MQLNPRSRVPRPAARVDLAKVKLSAEEGFVWSRVDGILTVEEICTVTGLSPGRTVAILERLAELGLIELETEQSQPEAAGGRPAAQQPSKEAPGAQARTAANPAPAAQPQDDSIEDFEPDPESDLPLDVQKKILAFWRRLDEMDFYEVLGVGREADRKEILRAYKRRSRTFHPDRYYGKRLGRYGHMLEEIFQHLTKVRDFLSNEEKRRAYDESLAEDARLEQAIQDAARAQEEALANTVSASQQGDSPPQETEAPRPYRKRPSRLRLKALASVLGVSQSERKPRSQPSGPGEPAPEMQQPPRRPRRRPSVRFRIPASMAPVGPDKAKAQRFYEEGLKKLLDGNFVGAATSLKLALTFDPGNEEYKAKYQVASERASQLVAERYFKQARFQESVGRWEAAARLYAQAADQDPKGEYLARAAEALLQAGDVRRAMDYARKGVQLDPQKPEPHMTLAKVCVEAGLLKNARREIEEVLGLDPENELAKTLLKEIRKKL